MLRPDLSPAESAEAILFDADALLHSRRDLHRASMLYDEALRRGIDPLRVAHGRWMCAMLSGDLATAWKVCDRVLVERRQRGLTCADRPYHERWVWDGRELQGRSVLIRCYHGLGDAIQFLRFAEPLRRQARCITVQVEAALQPIVRRMGGIDEVVELGCADPPYDVDIEANELPHALGTSLSEVGRDRAYIAIDPADVALRRRALGAPNRRKVGVVWAAGSWRPERSIPLARLQPIWQVPGIDFVILQRGGGLVELDSLHERPPLLEWGARSTDLLATAEMVLALDLVIAVDTMIAHLAGALAVPTWTLLHWQADWRWLSQGASSPWYPAMRLFRQHTPGCWTNIVDAVTAELRVLQSNTNG